MKSVLKEKAVEEIAEIINLCVKHKSCKDKNMPKISRLMLKSDVLEEVKKIKKEIKELFCTEEVHKKGNELCVCSDIDKFFGVEKRK